MIDKTISHYKILEKLGGGGMGVVYKAEDTKLKRFVALKFLPPDLTRDEEAKQRFINEAQAASALDHPNICNIHEIDETEDGQTFIVMAYYEGETLRKKVTSNQLSVDSVIDIAIQIAQGLAKAHQHGIIHRDVKPANVIVTNDGVVKIIDFGLAKLMGTPGITKTPSTMGTVAYMSPEQTQGEIVDHRTDIWSLGVVLYEMLNGQLPFKGEYDQAVVYSILNEEPKPLTELRSDLSIALAQVVEKMLQKDRHARYQHVNEMLADLRQLKGEATPRAIMPASKKRARALVLTGLISATAILALLGYLLWPQPQQEIAERIPVAVTDFVNETKEEELNGLSGLLITSLEQSRRLSVLTRSRMFDVLRQMGKENVDRIDETLGQEICQRANVKTLVTASIRKFGRLYTIDLKILDLQKNEYLLATNETGEGQESIPGLIDKLSAKTRAGLKERTAEIRAASPKVAEVTTINLEAYRHYFLGEQLIDKLQFKEAEDEFKQALTIDSTFGLAYYRLAYANWWRLGSEGLKSSEEQMMTALQKALALIDRIPVKEQYFVRALRAKSNSDGGFEAEISILKEMERIYPDDKEMLYLIGDDSYHIGDYATAVKYLAKVLAMDPTFERALQHLVRAYADWGQYDKMLEAAQKFKLLNAMEGDYFIGEYYYHIGDYGTARPRIERFLALASKDWTYRRALQYAMATCIRSRLFNKAEEILEAELLEEKKRSPQNRYSWHFAHVYPYLGKYRKAIKVFDDFLAHGWQSKDTTMVTDIRINTALYFAWGWKDFANAWSQLESALQHERYIPYWWNVAVLYAYRGEYTLAEKVELQKVNSAQMQQFIRLFIHCGKHECAEAQAIAKRLFPSLQEFMRTWALYSLALCQFEKGLFDEARTSLLQIQGYSDNTGGFHAVFYPKSFFLLGRIYEQQGDRKLAIENYQKLLELWKDADQDLPELLDAKARLAKLHGAR